jgi:outer membrane protein OmpA-like peptidoglycan-associated protein
LFSRDRISSIGLVLAGVACLALSACATQEEEVVPVQKPSFNQTMFDLTNGGRTDPLEMAKKASSPNVQVFPFDKPGVSASGLALTPPPGAKEYSGDPSVEVFPLEDAKPSSDVERVSLDGPGMPQADALLGQPSVKAGKPQSPNFVSIEAPGEPVVRIYFAHDSSDLDPSAMGDISTISARFNPNREDYILSVEGHASTQSSEADPIKRRIVNMRVATDRAYNVARALMEAGIAPEKIRTVSWGESLPAKAHDGMDANAASRRVEIFRVK